MAQPSPWQSYLASAVGSRGTGQQKAKPSVILPFIADVPEGPRAEVFEEEKRGLPTKLAAGFLGATTAVGKPVITTLFNALGVVGRGFLSTAKEGTDAIWQLSNKLDSDRQNGIYGEEERRAEELGGNYNYTPSLKDWVRQIREPLYAQDIIPALAYDKDASGLEKTAKEVAGFGLDIRAGGGFRGGVRLTGTLGRKNSASLMQNDATQVFKRLAGSKGLSGDDLIQAADDFGQQAAIAYSSGRSGAVRRLFEKEFGLEAGRDAFLRELTPELQGGVRIIGSKRDLGEATTLGKKLFGEPEVLRAYNAGGLTTQKILDRIGLGNLVDEPQKAVEALMKLKNAARGDALSPLASRLIGAGVGSGAGLLASVGSEDPLVALGAGAAGGAIGGKTGVGGVLRVVNAALNNIGNESATWSSFARAAATDDHKEISRMYKNWSSVAPEIRNLRESQVELLRGSKAMINDLEVMKETRPEAYATATKLMADPREIKRLQSVKDTLTTDDLDILEVAQRHQDEFTKLRLLAVAEGIDIGKQENYLPLIMGREAEAVKSGAKAGFKGMPGRGGFDFTLERKAYLDEDGVPLLPFEVREKLIREGREDLADLIAMDPANQLATYALNLSKMIARKRAITQIRAKGGIFRTDIAQLNVSPEQLDVVLSGLTPAQLDKIFTDQLSEPGQLYKYFSDLNDEMRDAFAANDPVAIQAVVNKVEMFRNAIGKSRKVFTDRQKKLNELIAEAEKAGNTEEVSLLKSSLAKLNDDVVLAGKTKAALGVARRGAVSEEVAAKNPLIKQIVNNLPEGTYRPVGSQGVAPGSYLPEDLEMLMGEKELVEAFERSFMFQTPGYQNKVNEVVDEFNNFFRASATFGKGPGFGIRNGVSALQTNMLTAGSETPDFKHAGTVVKTLLWTERGLAPFRALTNADLATKRIDRMAGAGKLTAEQTKRMKDDLRIYGSVTDSTLTSVQDEIMKQKLSKVILADGITGWDTYTTMRQGGVFDDYVIFQGMPNEEFYDDSVMLLGLDPSKTTIKATQIKQKAKQKLAGFLGEDTDNRFIVNASRRGEDRTYRQRMLEGILNAGWDIELADGLGGRPIKIRPIQNSRDFNRVIEFYNRAVPVATGLRRYGNTAEGQANSVILMKAAQYDYSNLTDVERRLVRRWAMPFWTWSKNNVPAMMRVAFNDPQRVANNLRGWDFVKTMLSDENGDIYFLPEYVTEMNGFLLDEDYRKKLLEDPPAWLENALDGKLLEVGQALSAYPIAIKPETPLADLVKLSKAVTDPRDFTTQTVAGSNPVAKAVMQIAFQKNAFSGKNYDTRIGTPAPFWVEQLSNAMEAVNPEWALGFPDSETGQLMVDEGLLDGIKALMPLIGTTERTALPVIEIIAEMVSGKPSDLSGQQGDRALTNLTSSLLGTNAYTITPATEISTLKDNYRRYDTYVRHTAGKYDISREKLYDLARNVLRTNPGISEEDLFTVLENARQRGDLMPDYLSEPAQ